MRRALPQRALRNVGSFVFVDHLGPVDFPTGQGLDVRPHPHIGLSTVTFLFEGAFLHRDSLGNELAISPGSINWMTAGAGIVHSERTPPEIRSRSSRVHALQIWVALPLSHEQTEPSFAHYPAASIPSWKEGPLTCRLLAGTALGRSSPVETPIDLFYLAVEAASEATLVIPAEHEERAVYVLLGSVRLDGVTLSPGQLANLPPGTPVEAEFSQGTIAVVFGGAPLDGPRYLDWNFVASNKELIAAAKERWRNGGFPRVPGDEEEFIPLP